MKPSEFVIRIFQNDTRLNLYRWDGNAFEADTNYELNFRRSVAGEYAELANKAFNKLFNHTVGGYTWSLE